MTMTENETTTRAALALAISAADAANAVAVKAKAAVTAASTMLDEAERDLAAARGALEQARDPQRPLAERLADAGSDDERQQLVDEHNAAKARPAVTGDDLREARVLVLDAEDRVVVARSELEQLQSAATSATAAANRAHARRQEAINEVVRPQCSRLMRAAERLTKEFAEVRLALRFIGANLADGYSDERRQIQRMLDRDLASLFPEEFGFKADPSAALAAWKAFAGAIEHDPSAPFPT
jgi:hypothetical protein